MPSNAAIARALQELADLTVMAEGSRQAFRVRAYEKAVDAIQNLAGEAETMTAAELTRIPGIGKSTAAKIREYVETGAITRLEELRAQYPPELMELTRIPGLGPKTVLMLRDRLGIESVDQLRAAIEDQALRALPGMGPRSEEKIARGIERLGLHGKDRRTPIGDVLPVADEIVAALTGLPAVTAIEYCGSLRRFRETIGDIDLVVAATHATPVMEAFVTLPIVAEVMLRGDTKTTIVTRDGMQVDLRVVRPSQFGAAILYFTGSKAHNIELRQRAIEHDLLLNEYALEEAGTGKVVASRTEKSIYRALGLRFIPPELREDHGEIAAAAAGTLPRLVTTDAIRGDLHVHSTWSGDGRSSLEDMIAAAAARGLDYLAMTEHGENLAINGLSREDVLAEGAEIERLRDRYPDMVILHGAELNIGRDGALDYDDDFLGRFDWCVAAVHSHFDLSRADQTARLLRAMSHPAVGAIGHLTGRLIGRRPGIDLDVEAVFRGAVETHTALEINSHLHRLDVPSTLLLAVRELDDLRFVISTDAHHTSGLADVEWGVRNARRGWVEKKSVINTWPTARFLAWVAEKG